jgi:arylsulfatase A-like enzyme
MNRRIFLKQSMAYSAAGFLIGHTGLEPAFASSESKKPNIVLFLVDDMGWQDTSEPFHDVITGFNKRYHTPNMERLADLGMKFTQAYACAICSPTRVSLMTGMNAARHRVTNWTLRKNSSTDAGSRLLRSPKWNVNGLSPVAGIERTVHAKALPEFLRQVGYRTIFAGKAHFGAFDTLGEDPLNVGFDVNIAGHAAGGPGSYLGKKNFGNRNAGEYTKPWGVPGLEKYHGKDIFLSEAITLEANKEIEKSTKIGKPFFLDMSHYAIHVPFAADNRFFQKYREAGIDVKESMYAALIEGMDKSLGDIMANLKSLGIEDETIILFMSDNGGLSYAARGETPDGTGPHTHNKPLSSGKGSIYEGGIRVPMIVHWPGVTKPNSVCDDYLIIEDFFPTILQMAGVKSYQQIGGVIDGVSFIPLLKGEKGNPDRAIYWHYPNNWGPTGPGLGAYSAIRKDDWKLIYYHLTGRFELFSLSDDIGETTNRLEAEMAIAKAMAKELKQFLKESKAQMPVYKSTSQAVPLPEIV